MFDNFSYLGAKCRELLSNSWAQLFQDEILRNLPVDLLKKYYSADHGRPTNELCAMMGTMILQQMHDLTDEQTVEQFCFNVQWHYAFNITNTKDTASYVCARSIWEMRSIMTENNLYQPLFESLSDHLRRVFEVDTSLQRLDSVHVFSNMRHLGRIRLFAATINKFLINLRRHHKGLFAELPEEMGQRYLAKNAESVFSLVKPSDAPNTLEKRDIVPDQVLADSLYGSDSNTCAALERGVDIIFPVMGGSAATDTSEGRKRRLPSFVMNTGTDRESRQPCQNLTGEPG